MTFKIFWGRGSVAAIQFRPMNQGASFLVLRCRNVPKERMFLGNVVCEFLTLRLD